MWRVLVVTLTACGFAPGAHPVDRDPFDAAADGPVADAAVDADVDAAAVTCPEGFDFAIGNSRYQIVTTNRSFWQQHALCVNAQPGATHLAVLDSEAEAMVLRQQLLSSPTQPSGSRYYIGVVQDPAAPGPISGWIHVTGGDVPVTLWSNFGTNGIEPDDNGDSVEDREEQIACIDVTVSLGYLVDLAGGGNAGAVCECDGKVMDATAEQYLAADPNNPN